MEVWLHGIRTIAIGHGQIPLQHLTCWVGLDDSSTANGCLQYVPKSHRWNLFDRTTLAGSMNGLDKFLTDEQKEQFTHKVPIEMKRGYGSFHHPLLVHGSIATS